MRREVARWMLQSPVREAVGFGYGAGEEGVGDVGVGLGGVSGGLWGCGRGFCGGREGFGGGKKGVFGGWEERGCGRDMVFELFGMMVGR